MKSQLKIIFEKNKKWFDVWIYLWINSDSKNTIIFTYSELGGRFNIPKSTIYRIIDFHKKINSSKVYIDLKTNKAKQTILKFYPTGKTENEKSLLEDSLYLFLIDFYKDHEYSYPELKTHKIHIKKIENKIKALISQNGEVPTESDIIATFKIFFEKIPDWWKQNAFTLPTISKNFNKIYNQIKLTNNGKNFKYANATKEIGSLDFEKISQARN
tara:strand:- start:793 stop:1434 length:642 start_codon:yes stop_codon:yes gene_type:complete